MALNVLIKEIDNLNISADDDTVTETVVRHGDDDNETISTEEIQAIVKKQIEENTTDFCDMTAEQVVDLFDEFLDKGIDLSKFDYRLYTKDYYAEKFPGFDPRFYECLEKASHEKFADQTEKKAWDNYTFENGEFVISWGKKTETNDKDNDNDESGFSDARCE
jgi:tagatose-1,6-bisphosphate aldolase